MAGTVQFELVSPERLLVAEPVEMVVVPLTEGDIGVLPGHSPLVGTVRPGVIDVHEDGRITSRLFVSGGFAEVTPERCTVLAEEAAPLGELDVAAAERMLAESREALADAEGDDARAAAARAVVVAEARHAAARQHRG